MINAIRIHRNGEPDEMKWEEIELPAPAPGEVRIRHTAIALNFSDVNVRRGGFYITPPSAFPLILGNEAAGVVKTVGAGRHRTTAGRSRCLRRGRAARSMNAQARMRRSVTCLLRVS